MSRGRPIEAQDIMILVRRRNDFFDEMVRALKLQNIPVAGTDRMVLSDQLAVMDLMALGPIRASARRRFDLGDRLERPALLSRATTI